MTAFGGRFTLLVAALAILLPAPFASGAEDEGDWLRLPGRPPIPMPPGAHVYGPGGGEAPNAAVPTPNNDIYHEYGTVTPGGGRRGANGSRSPNGDQGLGGRELGGRELGGRELGGRELGGRELGGRELGGRDFGGRDFSGQGYGGMVIGPGGVMKPEASRKAAAPPKKAPPTPEQKQAQIRKALAPKPPLALARRKTLDDLYARLAAAKDEDESKGLASLISAIWLRSGSDTANLLMARADKAIDDKKYPLALQVLDRVVDLQPNWPEAWNKRASVRYLAGDLNGAMADVDRVLKLEPNHFMALSGLAAILARTGFEKRALQVYRRELAIYPHQPDVEKIVEKLTLSVEGQGI